MKQLKNEPIPHIIKRSQASKMREIITALQIQNLAEQGQLVFLAIVRPAHDVPQTRRKRGENKKSPIYAATAHEMIEGQKRKMSKETGPKKKLINVVKREQQTLNSVLEGQTCAPTATGVNGNGRFIGTGMAVASISVAASAGNVATAVNS